LNCNSDKAASGVDAEKIFAIYTVEEISDWNYPSDIRLNELGLNDTPVLTTVDITYIRNDFRRCPCSGKNRKINSVKIIFNNMYY